jgi:large subunit ribosomal protein L1
MAEAKKATKTKSKAAKEAELVAETAAEQPVQEAAATEPANETAEDTAVEAAEPKATAKAGKRSAKAVEAAEEKAAKEERKTAKAQTGDETADKPKLAAKPARSRLERRGKKFQEVAKLIEAGKVYSLEEALKLAPKTSTVKFDATVELHINLGVDPRQADQNIRDNLVLPAGTGKSVRIAVFADDAPKDADISGVETITKSLEKSEINFDILIATPANMPKLGKYARMLGPRGLMPNPKSGTVTNDVAKAVQEAKAGRVEYRVDSTGIVHMGIGKVSFTPAQLLENGRAVLTSIRSNKPASVKSNYVKAIHLTTSMGPSIPVATSGE